MLIKNGTVITPFEAVKNTDVVVEDGVIIKLDSDIAPRDGETVIDAEDCYVCPGFVDIHTHGGGGADFMDATDESFEKALRFHAQNGTTSLLASSVTAPIPQIENMLDTVRRYKNQENPICRILGAHIEGPFLSVKNKGAQNEKYLRIPKRDGYDFIIKNKDVIVNVTISPELDGAAEMAQILTSLGIVVSGGHDDAQKSNIMPVIDAGLTNLTHIFCAMSNVAMRDGVRSVGLNEIGLLDDRVSVELIADNKHLPPELVRLAYKCKGARMACVVSDCLRAGGMPPDGTLYTLGPIHDENAQKFIVSEDVARLPDGSRYAGSIQPISRMVKNLVNDCNIPLVDAVCMASYTPAKIIGMQNETGSITEGKKADFCIMDKALSVAHVIVNGKIIK